MLHRASIEKWSTWAQRERELKIILFHWNNNPLGIFALARISIHMGDSSIALPPKTVQTIKKEKPKWTTYTGFPAENSVVVKILWANGRFPWQLNGQWFFPWCFSGMEINSCAVLAISIGASGKGKRFLAGLLQLPLFFTLWEDGLLVMWWNQSSHHIRNSGKKSLPKALKPLLTSAGKLTGSTLKCQSQILPSNLLWARCF